MNGPSSPVARASPKPFVADQTFLLLPESTDNCGSHVSLNNATTLQVHNGAKNKAIAVKSSTRKLSHFFMDSTEKQARKSHISRAE